MMHTQPWMEGLWNIRMMAEALGLPYETLYARIRRGRFPYPTHTLEGGRRAYWKEPEALAIVAEHKAQG